MKPGLIFMSLLLLIFCSLITGKIDAQVRYQNIVGGTGISTASYGNIARTSDGGFVTTGSYFQLPGGTDLYVTKFNNTGNLEWTRIIGDSTDQTGFYITQTSDGGYAIAGRSNTAGAFMGLSNGYVVKLNSAGNLQWARNIGGYQIDEFRSIVETYDGGLVVAGYSSTFCFGIGVNDFYAVKLDMAGNILWTRNIGGTGADLGIDMVQTPDSGLVIAGYTFSYGQGGSDFYCVKLNSSGALLWTTSVGGPLNDWAYSITKTIDGGFAIAGFTSSYGTGNDDFYIVKLDGNGNLMWTRTVGGSGIDRALRIVQDQNGNYIVAGYTDSFGAGTEDCYVVKLDVNGNLLWTRTIGGAGIEEAWGILADTDGGYVLSGYSNSFGGSNNRSMYILKLDSNGNTCANQGTGGTVSSGGVVSTGGVTGTGGSFITGATSGAGGAETVLCYTTGINESVESSDNFTVYPNPFTEVTHILFNNEQKNTVINIFDVVGNKINSYHFSGSKLTIERENMQAGIYIVQMIDNNNYVTNYKIVVQ